VSVTGGDHIIQKQFIAIDFGVNPNGLSVQNELAELFYEKLFPRMQILFDELGNDNYLISFEKLQIDLGSIPARHWQETLVEETLSALRQELLAADKVKLNTGEKARQIEACFLHFLQKGHLPWNSAVLSVKEFEQISPGIDLVKRLKELIQASPVAIDRLVYNFSEHFLYSIIKVLAEEAKLPIEDILMEEEKPISNQRNLKIVLQKILLHETKRIEHSSPAVIEKNSRNVITKTPAEMKDELYVHNAGLVILHPFLPGLFKTLDLYDNKEWQDENSRYTALHIMEYMVTGTDECPEFNLVLNKILCGLQPAEALKPVTPLSPEMKAACDIMLQAVVQHWSALKNSSVEALRETYLQRFGKLTASDHGWSLQVEPKAVDVLLGRLPWGIGTIRLPWMKNLLFAEWYQ
jgi:hypothetical protein